MGDFVFEFVRKKERYSCNKEKNKISVIVILKIVEDCFHTRCNFQSDWQLLM